MLPGGRSRRGDGEVGVGWGGGTLGPTSGGGRPELRPRPRPRPVSPRRRTQETRPFIRPARRPDVPLSVYLPARDDLAGGASGGGGGRAGGGRRAEMSVADGGTARAGAAR